MLRERIKLQFGEGGEARKRLDRLAADDVLSGAVAVALGNDVLFERAYGMADRANGVPNRVDTQFNLASMGKMFTALAVARLAEKGRLNFQDAVTRYVSGLPKSSARSPSTICSRTAQGWGTISALQSILALNVRDER